MTTATNSMARIASARSTRASSLARDIAKRREKPYKTERKRVMARKKKLELHTSHTKAPEGYTFLPVGTPDLAERCKELSRQKGCTVNVVNAKPVSKYAHDPEKVSYHIHRIGYHFKAEIVDEACEDLGYTLHRGQFIKFEDLEQQHKRSAIAAVLARYGLKNPEDSNQRETPAQVRAAIKELFPRIPEIDLNEIVRHAWEEGTHRVGTNEFLELPRRVQLATIARIRHTYTDYDRLLRAFEWREARQLVEQECLHKLIEWRGEDQDVDDDNQLEEIVRETIVIDDDEDDVGRAGSEADDEDSVTELDPGETSDTSIEISHHVVADNDFGAETSDEQSKRYLGRVQPLRRNFEQQTSIARQKIEAAREQRFRIPPQLIPLSDPHTNVPRQATVTASGNDELVKVQLPANQSRQFADEVVVDGRRYRRVRAHPNNIACPPDGAWPTIQPQAPAYSIPPEARAHEALPAPESGAYGRVAYSHGRTADSSPYTPLNSMPGVHAFHDRPMTSIEREEPRPGRSSMPARYQPYYGPGYVERPATPDSERAEKRRRLEPVAAGQVHIEHARGPADNSRPIQARNQDSNSSVQPLRNGDVVDWTAPDRRENRGYIIRDARQPSEHDSLRSQDVDLSAHHGALHGPPFVHVTSRQARHYVQPMVPKDALPYDPIQPLLQSSGAGHPDNTLPIQAVPADYVDPSTGQRARPALTVVNGGIPDPRNMPEPPVSTYPSAPYYRVVYENGPYPPKYPAYPPQPVHGAPAPVQLIPVHAGLKGSGMPGHAYSHTTPGPTHIPPRPPPANGAVAPTQYYYPR